MSEPIPISALQHFIFCPRQCALIHIEGLWAENRQTAEGRIMHRRAHAENVGPRGGGRSTLRGGTRTLRGIDLWSDRLGLIGKSDIVEFHYDSPRAERSRSSSTSSEDWLGTGWFGAAISEQITPEPGVTKMRKPPIPHPFPIEYKRGRPKMHDADLVQLCAQALCLEDMFHLLPGDVPAGAIYYGKTKHRVDVAFTAALRSRTLDVVRQCRELLESGRTPRSNREKKCTHCSLIELCLPEATQSCQCASAYLHASIGNDARD